MPKPTHFYCLLICLCLDLSARAQFRTDEMPEHNVQLLELNDKDNSPYSVFRPQYFLTAAALERKSTQGIEIDELDIPVNPNYLLQIQQICPIHASSRWLNAVAVHCNTNQQLRQVKQLPFVSNTLALGKFRKRKKAKFYTRRPPIDSSKHQANYYGKAYHQIEMLQGIELHQLGYTGKDVSIAVVDGGFNNAYRMWVFDSMYLENRLLGTHDFVDGDDYVYQSSTHGSSVLSTMAAKRPHLLVGTAPDASYYLFRTEDVKGEYRLEEFNWIVAMEYADSLGADIVNSSMGYNQFRDTSMSYSYQDMDGQTTLISRGAALAVAKGLLIVNAIGNDGNKAWRYLFAPADVATVLTVGAVDSFRQSSRFSSRGPSSDGRLKPDIVAQGSSTAYATMTRYDVALGEGTSYACPVMTGMVASLKSAFPTLQNQRLKEAIFKSSHQANKPDYDQGYGIPNFLAAYLYLLEDYIMLDQNIPQKDSTRFLTSNCHILLRANQPTQLNLKAYDYFGRLIEEKLIYYSKPKPSSFKLPLSTISKVCYLQITTNNKRYFYKINKKP